MYVPWNVPVEASGTMNQMFAFGQPESGEQVIAPSVEGERAGDSDGG